MVHGIKVAVQDDAVQISVYFRKRSMVLRQRINFYREPWRRTWTWASNLLDVELDISYDGSFLGNLKRSENEGLERFVKMLELLQVALPTQLQPQLVILDIVLRWACP